MASPYVYEEVSYKTEVEMAANSSSELTFVDEDDLPVAFLRIAHEDSENEAPLNVNSSDSENSSDESEDESDDSEGNSDEVYSNLRWSSCIQAHQM